MNRFKRFLHWYLLRWVRFILGPIKPISPYREEGDWDDDGL